MKNRYVGYLHSIGLNHEQLARIGDHEDFYKNIRKMDFNKYRISDIKRDELLLNHDLFDELFFENELKRLGARMITIVDEDYPPSILNMPNPPYLIYVRGALRNDITLFSIVGARECTNYSYSVLKEMVPGLLEAGFGIVSGGAYGVDSIAHKLTLANEGYTISVIGTGIDKDYPRSNRELYEKILSSGGAIITTFRLGTKGDRQNFPIRNSIIAGLSRGVLITEAREQSGSLITANLALELNKDVFVIPGDITKESSIGTNGLIRDGLGKAVTCTDDILIEYDIERKTKKKKEIVFQDIIDEKIYEELCKNPLDASSIADKLSIDIQFISFRLSMMEIAGYVRLGNTSSYEIR